MSGNAFKSCGRWFAVFLPLAGAAFYDLLCVVIVYSFFAVLTQAPNNVTADCYPKTAVVGSIPWQEVSADVLNFLCCLWSFANICQGFIDKSGDYVWLIIEAEGPFANESIPREGNKTMVKLRIRSCDAVVLAHTTRPQEQHQVELMATNNGQTKEKAEFLPNTADIV